MASRPILAEKPPSEPQPAPIAETSATPRPDVTSPVAARVAGLPMKAKIGIGVGALALLAILAWGGHWLFVGRFFVSTDDAYLQADVTPLVAKVSGYVAAIRVADNATVRQGDILAEIDPGDYELAVRSAKDKIAAQHATIDRLAAQILASAASEDQASAQIVATEAARVRADADFQRASTLAARDVGSRQALDQARAARDSAVADVTSARAALAQAEANTDVVKAQGKEANATLSGLQTSLASAERDLSFTKIRAPADGTVGNRAGSVGSFVSVGSRLMALVPASTVYVAANFKETQLAEIHPGQEAHLAVDAVEDVTVGGRVESIAPASGSVFSLLPVENATGNFTKIVQRVPVRIALSREDVERYRLRPGLSVVVDIDTRTTPAAAGQ